MKAKKPLKSRSQLGAKTVLKAKKPLTASQGLNSVKRPTSPTKKRLPLEKKPLSKLRKIADEWFSRYVRLRDSQRVGDEWRGRCITCSYKATVAYADQGVIRFARNWDNGHFIGRDCWATRYEEENNNLQCSYRCNRMRSGEYQKYKAALRLKYGDEVPEKLEKMAEDYPAHTYKHSREELLEIIHSAKEYIAYFTANA